MATRKIQRAAANKMKRNLRLFMFFRQTKVRKRFMLYVDFRVSYVRLELWLCKAIRRFLYTAVIIFHI